MVINKLNVTDLLLSTTASHAKVTGFTCGSADWLIRDPSWFYLTSPCKPLRSVYLISYGITFKKDVPFANTARPNGYEVLMSEHHIHAEQVPFYASMTPIY